MDDELRAHEDWCAGKPGMYVIAPTFKRAVAGPFETVGEAIAVQAKLAEQSGLELRRTRKGRLRTTGQLLHVIARRGLAEGDDEDNEVEANDRLYVAVKYFRRALYSDDKIRAELERMMESTDEW